MTLTKQVEKKLNEYGVEIFNDYHIEKDDEHVFYAESMIIFVNDKEHSISVTFQATTKPERAATLALILNQVKRTPIHVMESFIFNEKNEFISGEKAYNLIKAADNEKVFREYQKQQVFAHILENADCHEC